MVVVEELKSRTTKSYPNGYVVVEPKIKNERDYFTDMKKLFNEYLLENKNLKIYDIEEWWRDMIYLYYNLGQYTTTLSYQVDVILEHPSFPNMKCHSIKILNAIGNVILIINEPISWL